MSQPNPLHRVRLTAPKPAGEGAGLATAALNDFKAVAESARAAAAEPAKEAEAPVEEIPEPRLSEAELTALTQFRALLDLNRLDVAALTEQADELQKQYERNKQIERRLKPLRLSDLLLRDRLEQEIPISPASGEKGSDTYDPGFSVTFRTIGAEVELDAGEVARRLAAQWPQEGEVAVTQNFVLQVTTLACGLLKIDGAHQAAENIHSYAEAEARRKAIEEASRRLLRMPIVLLNELFSHQRMFTARVRKVLGHAGYMEQQVGNS